MFRHHQFNKIDQVGTEEAKVQKQQFSHSDKLGIFYDPLIY